ncbi:MAG: Mbeg1-like protein [Christensenellales bacterium]
MTTKELLYLSWLTHIDLPELYITLLSRGGKIPVAALADAILRMDDAGALTCVELYPEARAAAHEMLSSDAMLIGYQNDNATTGLVAYTFEDAGQIIVAMRGSETAGGCVPSNIDWTDNFCTPFLGSVQYPAIREIARAYEAGDVIFTGHSKGGHNALYALVASENPNARAVSFNGQGFAHGALTAAEEDALAARGVNYVVAADLIGALLEHPERRVYVKQAEGTRAHMPEAFTFDEFGEPIPALRAPASVAAELSTRAVDRALKGGTRGKLRAICEAILPNSRRQTTEPML